MTSKFNDITKADAIDMEHVDYDDVLQLYKGWKKSETKLKEKTRQLAAVNDKVKTLQESHFTFRSQIQALESVKELTLSLQYQVSALQADNDKLLTENKELNDLNHQAEEILRQRLQKEVDQSKQLHECQHELSALQSKYDLVVRSHKEVDSIAADEQSTRLTVEKKLEIAYKTIDQMKEDHRILRLKFESSTSQLSQCDYELAHASEQLSILSKEIANIQNVNDKLATSEAELGVLKGDISRLVHLLEFYPSLKSFLKRWHDSEGMSFVGLGSDSIQDDNGYDHSAINYLNSLYSSVPSNIGNSNVHDDGDVDDDDEVNIADKIASINNYVTPLEYDHIKRVHNNDPFPIIAPEEESNNWVPRNAAEIGMQFLKKNIPHAPPSLLMDFMRKMNKAWSRREARKIKRLKEVYDKRIADMKRQLTNARPYRGVMAEKQIRRLKAQVSDSRKKILSGHARQPEDEAPDYADEDFMDMQNIDLLPPHQRRPCMIQAMNAAASGGSGSSKTKIEKATTKKLLEASLMSLETLGRQISNGGGGVSMSYDASVTGISDTYPSDTYLRGALWLGKNVMILLEELVEALDTYRTSHLSEISSVSHDTDARRACHRLTLLAASGANEMVSMSQKARSQARDILQGVALINPGESLEFQNVLTKLPIESKLGSSSRMKASTSSFNRSKTPLKSNTGSLRY